jgi:hypothetical protein
MHFTFVWPCVVTNFLIIKPTRRTNFSNLFWTCLGQFLCPSSGVFHCTQQYYMSYSSRIRILLLESCLQTCMTHTIAECTVLDSWLWTEELSETCAVSFQNNFEILVHLVGFIIRIMMYVIILLYLGKLFIPWFHRKQCKNRWILCIISCLPSRSCRK